MLGRITVVILDIDCLDILESFKGWLASSKAHGSTGLAVLFFLKGCHIANATHGLFHKHFLQRGQGYYDMRSLPNVAFGNFGMQT